MAKLCVKCKNLLPDDAQFCQRCGTRQPGCTPVAQPPAKKNNTGLTVLLIVLAVIAIAAIAGCVILLTGGRNDSVPPTPAVTEPVEPAGQETDGEDALPPHTADPEDTEPGTEAPGDGEDTPVTGDTPDTPAAPDTPPATPGDTEPDPGPVQPEGIDVDTFNQIMEGVWVDMASCQPMGNETTFQFCQLIDGAMCFAAYPGGMSRTGYVTDVVCAQIDETTTAYTVTFYYREEEYMGDYYEDAYETYTFMLHPGDMEIQERPGVLYSWMGYNLDQAISNLNP